MLTGYIGSATFLDAVAQVLERLQAVNPNLKYVCDPVLGDNGHLYVPGELTQLYRDKIIPRAWMITPNQFEVE